MAAKGIRSSCKVIGSAEDESVAKPRATAQPAASSGDVVDGRRIYSFTHNTNRPCRQRNLSNSIKGLFQRPLEAMASDLQAMASNLVSMPPYNVWAMRRKQSVLPRHSMFMS